ncbi:MAG: M1 family metallopeptidase [Dinghuibacter sp.]|nr:M1 family metallopeptidase [Dinghuibacter sp.]
MIRALLFSFLFSLSCTAAMAQPPRKTDTAWKKIYRYTPTRINNLVHTKIDARFNIPKATMDGKVWITLQPHFYATDSLNLDAKGMTIKQVALVAKNGALSNLKYTYNGMNLFIQLNKTYTAREQYMVYVEYTAHPNELEAKGSAAISDAKGLYFINPDGSEPDKPTQIWTQGETEATSVWCPTIDRTAQKCTQETYMTVPANWVTLSNGKLVKQTPNKDGTRTDYWKMELPHSPYLFFMGAGDFAVVKDSYRGKEVNYYVEKEYAPVAKKIFGHTPEMIGFFSKLTGVEYPWVKYSQIVCRDYVSGAMENTTAVIHQETAHQNARELTDGNAWESTISHELFHHWFGDYVTSESWSNLTVNESFADYSQTLWDEYKYGKDAGDAENYNGMELYLQNPAEAQKHLVRFYYRDKEEMFDRVSYQKGGRILHMLRNYLGDSAFFKGLNHYLVTNKFKSGEAHQLRLSLEEISGRDLTWFFNQWYFNAGHPKLDIDYTYNDNAGNVTVFIKQTQTGNAFRLPIAIDVYNGANKQRYPVWVENKVDSFVFPYTRRPDLVNVDGDKMLLCTKKENNKTLEQYIHQYQHAGTYMDRREAIVFAGKTKNAAATDFLKKALNDRYHGLRLLALEQLPEMLREPQVKSSLESSIRQIARTDAKKKVKAKAIELLGLYGNNTDMPLFEQSVKDSSYSVAGAALTALAVLDINKALTLARQQTNDARGALGVAVGSLIMLNGSEDDFNFIYNNYKNMPPSQEKFDAVEGFTDFLVKMNNTDNIKKGIDAILSFRKLIPEQFRPMLEGEFKRQLNKVGKAKGADIQDYIKKKME